MYQNILDGDLIKYINRDKKGNKAKVLIHMLRFYYNKTNHTAFPKQQTIADDLGINIRTVERCINSLKNEKWINVKKNKRYGEYGPFQRNSYTFPEIIITNNIIRRRHHTAIESVVDNIGKTKRTVGAKQLITNNKNTHYVGKSKELFSKGEENSNKTIMANINTVDHCVEEDPQILTRQFNNELTRQFISSAKIEAPKQCIEEDSKHSDPAKCRVLTYSKYNTELDWSYMKETSKSMGELPHFALGKDEDSSLGYKYYGDNHLSSIEIFIDNEENDPDTFICNACNSKINRRPEVYYYGWKDDSVVISIKCAACDTLHIIGEFSWEGTYISEGRVKSYIIDNKLDNSNESSYMKRYNDIIALEAFEDEFKEGVLYA
jgi:DNA replication protein DnaD